MFDSKAQVELFDIMRLLGGKIHRGSIDQLQGEVNEMICLWESHFPASENYFQLHQIMDLVSSIPLFGSMHSWSDLLGEKALGYLKKIKMKSNHGGTLYEKNIMQRHVDREISILNRFYSSAVNETDKKEQLQGEVNEMICLWECHYPASENYFQLHHIMDLVSSIHLDAIYSVLPFSAEMDKISEDMDSSLFLLDTATKAKEDGDKLNWN